MWAAQGLHANLTPVSCYPSDHAQTHPARSARTSAPDGEDLRQPGREDGREEHDGGGTLGTREEGSQGGSEEADGRTSVRAPGQSGTDGREAKVSHATASAARSVLSVSMAYAGDVRRGKRRPHRRHWVKLTELVGCRRMRKGRGRRCK